MQELLKIHEALTDKDSIIETPICNGASEFLVNSKELFVVCDEDGEEELLREYRNTSIEAAKLDIPEVYHDFFEFTEFADYNWQSIYDIYEKVDEVYDKTGKKYFICSV